MYININTNMYIKEYTFVYTLCKDDSYYIYIHTIYIYTCTYIHAYVCTSIYYSVYLCTQQHCL